MGPAFHIERECLAEHSSEETGKNGVIGGQTSKPTAITETFDHLRSD
jgi:hypothetical protein